ncbi:MAG TPA: DMT family transporter [Marmoricola sp.]|nr:DMT family transporter [Marmoricola sp.]
MSMVTDDTHAVRVPSRLGPGLGFAVLSAASFGLSGPLARGLMDAGWSPGAAVTVRIVLATVVLVPPALVSLAGRWWLLRRNALTILLYGGLAVTGAQFAYFQAVSTMAVAVALLIEYTAPVAVICWLWLRHGQRPGRRTLAGAVVAAAGLVLVLDVLSGGSVNLAGVLWALGAMTGAATYFVISADEGNGLPPLVLAAGGLVTGAVLLLALGAVGLVPMRATTHPVVYADHTVVWWLPLLGLGLVTAALSYTTGIAAGRRLGSRLASFVALMEVLAALLFAWLLVGQMPHLLQLVGGIVVLAGVVLVKLGEPRVADEPIELP